MNKQVFFHLLDSLSIGLFYNFIKILLAIKKDLIFLLTQEYWISISNQSKNPQWKL